MTDPLTNLLDAAEAHARGILIGTAEALIPVFMLQDGEDQGYLVATPFVGENANEVAHVKDAVAYAVRRMIKAKKIVRYSFLSEAWMTVRPPGWNEAMGPPPSESDDRREVVIAMATDGGDYKLRRWLIKRNGEQCVDLILDSKGDEVGPGGGRFDHLLTPQMH
jgi:hypothetical protein